MNVTNTVQLGSSDRVYTSRRSNGRYGASLLRRRSWHAEGDSETPPPAPPATEGNKDKPTPPTSPEDAKTPANDGMVQMTQSALDKIMAERAAQAKRSVLKDAGIENPGDLKIIVEAHKQAEEKRKEAEEANKSELTKKQEQLDASVVLQTTQSETIKSLTIENAFMRLAPGKEIPAERFNDFLVLMDASKIVVTDGKVEDSEVQAAIDKTLEGRDYLKATTNGRSHGSPPRNPASPKLPTPKEQQPVQRNRKASM